MRPFLRYYKARLEEERETVLFRNYMADSLFFYARGKAIGIQYSDAIKQHGRPVENRSGDQIAADLIARMGLKVR